jgi:uncharacterized protein (DUF433 family)
MANVVESRSPTSKEGSADMEIAPGISVDPKVCHGAPVITGTRVLVSIVLGSLAGGMSKEEVTEEYGLRKEDVEAALAYATDLVSETHVAPLPGV